MFRALGLGCGAKGRNRRAGGRLFWTVRDDPRGWANGRIDRALGLRSGAECRLARARSRHLRASGCGPRRIRANGALAGTSRGFERALGGLLRTGGLIHGAHRAVCRAGARCIIRRANGGVPWAGGGGGRALRGDQWARGGCTCADRDLGRA